MDENKLDDNLEVVVEGGNDATDEKNSIKKVTKKVIEFLATLTSKQKLIGAIALFVVYTLIVGAIGASIQKRIIANQIEKSIGELFPLAADSLNGQKQTAKSEKKQKPAKKEIKNISIGDTVTTENYEFTLNSVELTYEVKPENPPTYYTYYNAPDGKVYIYVNASVKNLSKQSVGCENIYSANADYDGGYQYQASYIADDSNGDFTYASITSIDPLETLGVHCLIECPKEVESSTDKPLFVTITFKDGSKYQYHIR